MRELLLPAFAAVVICAALVWLIDELRKRPSLWRQLEDELHQGGALGRRLGWRAVRFRLPVYSAETVQGKEAEFIRDRLPIKPGRKLLMALLTIALTLALLMLWWPPR
jgi:heme A synthase